MADSTIDGARLLESLIDLALEAGAAALRVYAGDFAVDAKEDASPVTAADRQCEEIILNGLSALAPEIPVLAEESAAAGRIPDLGETFFLVDPLDGTKEFVSRNGEFTINIALVRKGRPVLGVVYAPAIGRLYAGGTGLGALRLDIGETGARGGRRAITARPVPEQGLVAVASRSHATPETEAFLKSLAVGEFAVAGSSLKFCLIAESAADVYPRLGRTMEWDTGAGQAVLEAAGGRVVVHPSGEPLSYGK
ncbi:MAG TPA: 3'(2'),5'-bisphosphate nucleotidase CysQ, partial [Parvularculaceae bacterium]|nr:3'(2'),5'-bisphosphate nucleotidase CysQ [Parvularculaceae bacterium]